MKQELKEIPIEKVYANFYQPREKFDKEQIKELAESILSNGLINPITVRQWKSGKYMIVAGERRWRAHKVAGLKTIQAVVKKYDNDGQWMVESLIENVHREDLQPIEKAKYLKRIMDFKKVSINDLGKITKIAPSNISKYLNLLSIEREIKGVGMPTVDYSTLSDISQIEDKSQRMKLLKKIETDGTAKVRQEARFMKNDKPEDVKSALLDDKINVEQAERISKLGTEKERERAIKEHGAIKNIERHVETHIKNQTENAAKRSFEKRLLETRNWLNSFRGSVTDSRNQLEQTFKVLMIATRFLSVMDEKQKERLDTDLDRFLETLEKSKQIAEKIQGYVDK